MDLRICLLFSYSLLSATVQDEPIYKVCDNYNESPCTWKRIGVSEGYCCPTVSRKNRGRCPPFKNDCGNKGTIDEPKYKVCDNYNKSPCTLDRIGVSEGYCCPTVSREWPGRCPPFKNDCGNNGTIDEPKYKVCDNYNKSPCRLDRIGVSEGYCCPTVSKEWAGRCPPFKNDCGNNGTIDEPKYKLCDNYNKSPCTLNLTGVSEGYCCPMTSRKNAGRCPPFKTECGVN